jgi:hypothetical protein
MRRHILGLSFLFVSAIGAGGQVLQPVEILRYQYYGVAIVDPQSCEGLEDGISEFPTDLEPMNHSFDRTLRCLETRARGSSNHLSSIGDDTLIARFRTMTVMSNGAVVSGGEARGGGENYEAFTFDLAQTTKLRIAGTARATLSGDAAVVDEVYLDAGFVLDGGVDTHVELAFYAASPGDGSIDQEVICPAGRYTFYAATTVLSCALNLRQPQQVSADGEIAVRVDVVYCPGDVNIDNRCDVEDLALLLAHYGMSGGVERGDGDLDGNRRIDASDLALLLGAFGGSCW